MLSTPWGVFCVCVNSRVRVITVLYECTCNWLAVEMNFLQDNKQRSNLIYPASFQSV